MEREKRKSTRKKRSLKNKRPSREGSGDTRLSSVRIQASKQRLLEEPRGPRIFFLGEMEREREGDQVEGKLAVEGLDAVQEYLAGRGFSEREGVGVFPEPKGDVLL